VSTNLTLSTGAMLDGYFPFFPTTGKVFHVNSTDANARDFPSHGVSPDKPFATIDFAVGQCRANKGDLILVGPGHAESVTAAGGLALDVAGVTVLGMGGGANRPTVTLSGATSATVTISASSVTVRNLIFVTSLDAIVTAIVITGADCTLMNIETRDASATQCVDFITTSAAANRLRISGWKHMGDDAAGADTAITIVGGDALLIEDFQLIGNFAVAAIENVTTACTNAQIGGGMRPNYIWTKNAADTCITMVATSTGRIGPNLSLMLTDNAANFAGATVGAAMQFFKPIQIVNLAGESSGDTTITASTNA